MECFLQHGTVLGACALLLMKCTPKFAQPTKAKDMCPMALQNIAMKFSPRGYFYGLKMFLRRSPPYHRRGS